MNTGVSGSYTITTTNDNMVGLVEYSETYDIPSNSSNVTVTLKLKKTGGATSEPQLKSTFEVILNGTKKTVERSVGAVSIPPTNTYITIFTQTFTNVRHNSNGALSVVLRVTGKMPYFFIPDTIKLNEDPQTITLTRIPQLSTITVASGVLGTAHSITVNREASTYTHDISYSCGSASGTICEGSSSDSVNFTFPISLAAQRPTGTYVSITLTIKTYNADNVLLGSREKTFTCDIPASVKPEVSISVEDVNGYMQLYDDPLQALSAIKITLNETVPAGCSIKSRRIEANGEVFTSSPCTTSLLKSTGANVIRATITDSRNRSGTATITLNALQYKKPTITKLTANRCNANGYDDPLGEYVRVNFSGTATALNNQNNAVWLVKYKMHSATSFEEVEAFDETTGHYNVNNKTCVFEADTGSTYDIQLELTDDFDSVVRNTSASTAAVIMHWGANGRTMSIGKVSEPEEYDLVDLGWRTRFYGGIEYVNIPGNTNLNDFLRPNFYVCAAADCASIINKPTDLSNNDFRLEVQALGTVLQSAYRSHSQIRQIITVNDADLTTYERVKISGDAAWGSWVKRPSITSGSFIMLTNNDTRYPTGETKIGLEIISASRNNGSALGLSYKGIKFNKPGYVVLSASVDISVEVNPVSSVFIKFVKGRGTSDSPASDLPGTWGLNPETPLANCHLTIQTSNIITEVEAGDEIFLYIDKSGGNMALNNANSFFTAFYI